MPNRLFKKLLRRVLRRPAGEARPPTRGVVLWIARRVLKRQFPTNPSGNSVSRG